MLESARSIEDAVLALRNSLLRKWRTRLADLGGDPSERDWARFRPLRLAREEDWSDWLAWLLEQSSTGTLARILFSESARVTVSPWRYPTISREERTSDGLRRADLVIEWSAGGHLHLEVKVGDENFEKTIETAISIRKNRAPGIWRDAILIPDWSASRWREFIESHSSNEVRVREIQWSELAVALRRTLWNRREDASWRAWAAAYCGAIERTLLGFWTIQKRANTIRRLDTLALQNSILERGKLP